MWIDKAATWQMARDLGGDALVELVVNDTHTCYQGARDVLHDWGYGCEVAPRASCAPTAGSAGSALSRPEPLRSQCFAGFYCSSFA